MADYKELVSVLRSEADGFLMADAPDVLMADSLNSAADAIEELIRENGALGRSLCECDDLLKKLERPKWISVDERMPDENERVVACVIVSGEPLVWDAVRWNGRKWEVEEEARNEYWISIDYPVTHWMPLPEPPKENTDG